MSDLDQKTNAVFAGKVVRKDLVRKVKVGANVPVYVLEYLLGKYCATDDPHAIDAGLRLVNTTLANNFVRPDEANKAQSYVKEKGRYTLIDKVKVRYLSDDDKYWAEIVNFGHRYVHVPDHYVRQYDLLLMGGIWAQINIRHEYDDEARGKRSPFWIDDIKPIQLGSFDFDDYCACRRAFDPDEWVDLLVRSIGLEPSYFDRRLKLLLLMRLVPLCEPNYNLVELGPRGTGKSYAFQEISPYAILLTGPTTVANLFYNLATNKIGLVGLWDAIAFDEVADLQKMPQEVVTTLKTYCESGTFARGKDALTGHASMALFGNTNQPVDVMVRSSHLFAPIARRHPRRLGLSRSPPLLHPWLGNPQDAGAVFHRPLWLRRQLSGRGAERAPPPQFYRDHRPPFCAGVPPQRPRREGRTENRVGFNQVVVPPWRDHPGRTGGACGAGAGGTPAGERTAQEDGLVRVLPDIVFLHRQ